MNSSAIQITYVSIVWCFFSAHHLHPNFFPLDAFCKHRLLWKTYRLSCQFSFLISIATQLTLTRMHQAQENIKRVKRKSNGLWQFELRMETKGKKFCIIAPSQQRRRRWSQEGVEFICGGFSDMCQCQNFPEISTTRFAWAVISILGDSENWTKTASNNCWYRQFDCKIDCDLRRKNMTKTVAKDVKSDATNRNEIVSTQKYFPRKESFFCRCFAGSLDFFIVFFLQRWHNSHVNGKIISIKTQDWNYMATKMITRNSSALKCCR